MPISSALGSSALLPAGLGFRNKIINGDFSINQRVFTSTTTSGTFGFDRWQVGLSGGTVTYSAQTFTPGNAISGQEPTNYARVVTSGHSASTDSALLIHKIEDVRNCAGQTATISFWAQAASGTPKVAVQISQSFGTGGSPSADVDTYVGQATLSTSWARYTFSFVVPSISGKTIGTTANTSFLRLNLWTSAGSNNNASTGSLGVQNATINLWGVQLEQNYQPTPFEQRPYGVELALCQRYYWRTIDSQAYGLIMAGGVEASTAAAVGCTLPVTMRATPSMALGSGIRFFSSGSSVITPTISGQRSSASFGSAALNITSGTVGQAGYLYNLPAANSYIEFSAEL